MVQIVSSAWWEPRVIPNFRPCYADICGIFAFLCTVVLNTVADSKDRGTVRV